MRVFLEMSRSSWGEMSRHGCFQAQASVPVGGEGEEESSCSMRLCIEWEVRPPSPDAARPGLGGYTSTVTLQGQSQSWPDPQGPRGLWGQGRSLQGSHSSSRGVCVCVCVCVCARVRVWVWVWVWVGFPDQSQSAHLHALNVSNKAKFKI